VTPAVLALVEFAEAVAEDQAAPADLRMKLGALAHDVRCEDPLALAFSRARAGFRSRER
jgi:hypothetical protein